MENPPFSDEKINAYVDNELADEERAQLLKTAAQEPAVARQICETRQLSDMLRLAYAQDGEVPRRARAYDRPWLSAAAVLLLCGLAWLGGMYSGAERESTLQLISLKEADVVPGENVLVHLNTMEPQEVREALDLTERLLRESRPGQMHVELVVNGDGIGLLREGSEYASRIRAMVANHENITFLACGIAMENYGLRDGGTQVMLLPEAQRIPAGFNRIVSRLRQGWTYVGV